MRIIVLFLVVLFQRYQTIKAIESIECTVRIPLNSTLALQKERVIKIELTD